MWTELHPIAIDLLSEVVKYQDVAEKFYNEVSVYMGFHLILDSIV